MNLHCMSKYNETINCVVCITSELLLFENRQPSEKCAEYSENVTRIRLIDELLLFI